METLGKEKQSKVMLAVAVLLAITLRGIKQTNFP
jgi:hypothetical protein